jgi:DNA polymerase III sliding clamp (beta) subunit (PCNA family)
MATISSTDLRTALRRVMFAVEDKNRSSGVMTGVYVDGSNAVGTDGRHLAACPLLLTGIRAIVPLGDVKGLSRLPKGVDVHFEQDVDVVYVSYGGRSPHGIVGIPGTYPNYHPIIPTSPKLTLSFDAASLRAHCRAGCRGEKVQGWGPTIVVRHGAESMRLGYNGTRAVSLSNEAGYTSSIDTTVLLAHVPALTINVKACHLEKALGTLPNRARVEVSLTAPDNPIALRSPDVPGWVYVTMPMRK